MRVPVTKVRVCPQVWGFGGRNAQVRSRPGPIGWSSFNRPWSISRPIRCGAARRNGRWPWTGTRSRAGWSRRPARRAGRPSGRAWFATTRCIWSPRRDWRRVPAAAADTAEPATRSAARNAAMPTPSPPSPAEPRPAHSQPIGWTRIGVFKPCRWIPGMGDSALDGWFTPIATVQTCGFDSPKRPFVGAIRASRRNGEGAMPGAPIEALAADPAVTGGPSGRSRLPH